MSLIILKSLILNGQLDYFPDELYYNNINEMINLNNRITEIKEQVKNKQISKFDAYQFAFEIENSSYELYYQNAISLQSNSEIMNIYSTLNKGDKNHGERIQKLIKNSF